MDKIYTYQRKDGGTTDCYGSLTKDSNIEITCENEFNDGTWTDAQAMRSIWNWEQLCKYLEANYNDKIEELVAV